MSTALRVGFAGTPDFAANILAALLESRHQVTCVFTQPDRPAGRGRQPKASPVKELAQAHDIEVFQPIGLRDESSRQPLVDANLDVLVVAAYGLILPAAVLDTPRLGALNVHASLLPRWRGAAPIQRAIEAGDKESGVTIMAMDEGLDTGDMLLKRRVPINATTTGGSLHDALAKQGASAIVDVLDKLAEAPHEVKAEAQPSTGITYAAKLTKAEAQLDFSQPASQLCARINAFNPWPVAWANANGNALRIWAAHADPATQAVAPGTLLTSGGNELRVACGEGTLCITRAQLPGSKALEIRELLASPKRAECLRQGSLLNHESES